MSKTFTNDTFLFQKFKNRALHNIEEGDLEKGLLPVGQATGLIHDEPTVAEVMERIVAEARQVQERLAAKLA